MWPQYKCNESQVENKNVPAAYDAASRERPIKLAPTPVHSCQTDAIVAENLELDRTNRAEQDVEQEPGFDKRSLGITHRGETAQIPRVPQRPFPKLDDAPVVAASVEEEQIPSRIAPTDPDPRDTRAAKGKDRDPEGTKNTRRKPALSSFALWILSLAMSKYLGTSCLPSRENFTNQPASCEDWESTGRNGCPHASPSLLDQQSPVRVAPRSKRQVDSEAGRGVSLGSRYAVDWPCLSVPNRHEPQRLTVLTKGR